MQRKFLGNRLRNKVISVLSKEVGYRDLPFKFKYLRFMLSDDELISTYKNNMCTLYTKSQHDKVLAETLSYLKHEITPLLPSDIQCRSTETIDD